jgi:hypothetical protein
MKKLRYNKSDANNSAILVKSTDLAGIKQWLSLDTVAQQVVFN